MPDFVNNTSILLRRIFHRLLTQLPQGLRTYLAGYRSLTRVFVYFDDARYQSFAPGKFEKITWNTGGHGALHCPMSGYNFVQPELTDAIRQELSVLAYKPLISVIMPVFDVDPVWLELAIRSVENQWYDRWELCIVDDNSSNAATLKFMEDINRAKVKVEFAGENGGISVSSNRALNMATGEYVALMDHDDELTVDALYRVVVAINNDGAEFIYSDEDKLDIDGSFKDPHFKPDWSPDTFLSHNYLSHLGVIKRSLIEKAGGFSIGLEGAQDYDLYLKVLERTNKITHIPEVLYHWRTIPGSTAASMYNKSYASESGRKAIELAIQRRPLKAKARYGKHPGTYRIQYEIAGNPLVSIIIPFNDKPGLLKKCIESILQKSTYQNYEVIGISNNSQENETFVEMERLAGLDKRVSFHELNIPFNFSAINNHAVKEYANGEHVLLLNNDIEIISPDWIESLLEFSQRPDVGAVGGKLYYPDETIQHAGIVIGISGLAGHLHKHFMGQHPGYFTRLDVVQNLSAVTAACLMVKQSIYKELDGLDASNLQIAFNDVDFCLRIREKGYLNIFTPYCEAYHHESLSRGDEETVEQKIRFSSEVRYTTNRHAEILKNGDPYYNHHLTLDYEDCSLANEEARESSEPIEFIHIPENQPKLLYMHIAKASGSTVNTFFANHYSQQQYALHIESNLDWQSNPDRLESLHFLSGHITVPAMKEKLEIDDYYKVTVIREPFAQLRSHLAWIRRLAAPGEEQRFIQHADYIQKFAMKLSMIDFSSPQKLQNLTKSLTDAEAFLIDNCQTRYFTPVAEGSSVVSADVDKAIEASGLFDRIGLTESLDGFLAGVANEMDWEAPRVFERENVTKEFFGLDISDDETRGVLKPLVRHDLVLYELIKERA